MISYSCVETIKRTIQIKYVCGGSLAVHLTVATILLKQNDKCDITTSNYSS